MIDHSVQSDRIDELKGTVTCQNLITAFSSDAQTCRLLALFARIAELEGYNDAARVLRELLESQVVFTDGHMDFLRRVSDPTTGSPIGETRLNLASVIAGEIRHFNEELPHMAATAHAEGFPDIASWFETLQLAKRTHADRVKTVLDGLKADNRVDGSAQ